MKRKERKTTGIRNRRRPQYGFRPEQGYVSVSGCRPERRVGRRLRHTLPSQFPEMPERVKKAFPDNTGGGMALSRCEVIFEAGRRHAVLFAAIAVMAVFGCMMMTDPVHADSSDGSDEITEGFDAVTDTVDDIADEVAQVVDQVSEGVDSHSGDSGGSSDSSGSDEQGSSDDTGSSGDSGSSEEAGSSGGGKESSGGSKESSDGDAKSESSIGDTGSGTKQSQGSGGNYSGSTSGSSTSSSYGDGATDDEDGNEGSSVSVSKTAAKDASEKDADSKSETPKTGDTPPLMSLLLLAASMTMMGIVDCWVRRRGLLRG